jgi:membrane associated rhomboid family serine protease
LGPVIPLKDDNPTRQPAIVNWLLIAACVIVYFLIQPTGQATLVHNNVNTASNEVTFDVEHAAIPCEIVHNRPLTDAELRATYLNGDSNACGVGPANSPPDFPNKAVYLAILYSMFLHGSLLHIGGNMLFLWIFGNNIEDRFGHIPYLLFYLAAGLIAAAAQVAVQSSSTVPIIGASGAIAGVMGAYLVLYPAAKILTYIFPFFVLRIRAAYVLLFWFASQFFLGSNSDVAWMAHVGGFTFGVIVGLVWRAESGHKSGGPQEPYPSQAPYPYQPPQPHPYRSYGPGQPSPYDGGL